MISVEQQIAMPDDTDLDCHLAGLRIDEVVATWGGTHDLEGIIKFGTGDAIGWWIDSHTGEKVYPDEVTSSESCFGLDMAPGFKWLLRRQIAILEAWSADRALVVMTSAPGKWTLLTSLGHRAGREVVLPRGEMDRRIERRPRDV